MNVIFCICYITIIVFFSEYMPIDMHLAGLISICNWFTIDGVEYDKILRFIIFKKTLGDTPSFPQVVHCRVKSKIIKLIICCFFAIFGALRRKSKYWLARNQDNGSEWSGMLFHWASILKIQSACWCSIKRTLLLSHRM